MVVITYAVHHLYEVSTVFIVLHSNYSIDIFLETRVNLVQKRV